MVKIIAEIGWNHCGDMNLAKEMILAAHNSGADYAKFQTWSVDRLKSGSWDYDGRRQIYEKAELTHEKHLELKKYCELIGIKFLSSVFSIEDAKMLVKIGCKEVKIPSFESRNEALIAYCLKNFKTVFMSTGTSSYDEIRNVYEKINHESFYLLHCVSSYPCKPDIANIPKMLKLKQLTEKIGYSDHIQGVESAKVAIEFGAKVIEKHFTTDNDLPGRDNKFAILPSDMKNLSNYIKLRNEMLIDHGSGYQSCEKDSRENYAGRFDG